MTALITLPNNIHQVSSKWLHQHLNNPNVIILDATTEDPTVDAEKQLKGVIPGSKRFDFNKEIVDTEATSPNMMPSPTIFEAKVKALGINQDSIVIVYDKQGLFSAARPWWMFKTLGFNQVAILQGGLPAWINAGFSVEPDYAQTTITGDFTASKDKGLFVDKQYVLNSLSNSETQIVDARGYGRFSGQMKEPRENMRSGHIPNSLNLHYATLINDGQLLETEKLKEIFHQLVPTPGEFVFSCGSGVTACILALAADIAGFDNIKVYDGSWSEWGADKLLPIDTVSK
ncbi:sulfurtransferase [Vibrio sp. SS-MA-C1-2]|uniref:sulfurtransferase n=1 Tax=Vibrio sp. SS-MA-C1-2 TaxID=2908646 RepID=UPI001F368215|nr:sulfurtransferase [Vibrio sp. SS-MA-C1-2]UJF18442.1 sulfurtransferase [Vibrio sp. SS-MA-C1-2]